MISRTEKYYSPHECTTRLMKRKVLIVIRLISIQKHYRINDDVPSWHWMIFPFYCDYKISVRAWFSHLHDREKKYGYDMMITYERISVLITVSDTRFIQWYIRNWLTYQYQQCDSWHFFSWTTYMDKNSISWRKQIIPWCNSIRDHIIY